MDRIVIVAITYNRPHSLIRLLNLLNSSFYDNDKVDLIVSIDKSDIEKEILAIAKGFKWNHGEKRIRTFPERQGLRNHVLQCGDYALEYGAVIVFEDDIIPAKNFYIYAKQALEFYNSDERIAGISLYSPAINEMIEKPFIPLSIDNADVYFIQSAQSWGQCWSRTMWNSFKTWYSDNSKELVKADDMPERIYSWPNTSWKKYYMKYIVDNNKYFVYPYVSLSTNASEIGEHAKKSTSRYQVPILYGRKNYKFIALNSGIIYDVFFENQCIAEYLNISKDELCVDLYGSKPTNQNRRYVITPKKINHKILYTYSLSLKPQELNVILNNPGKDLYLYDLEADINIELKGQIEVKKRLDYYSSLNWKDSLRYGLHGLTNAIIDKLLKFKSGGTK